MSSSPSVMHVPVPADDVPVRVPVLPLKTRTYKEEVYMRVICRGCGRFGRFCVWNPWGDNGVGWVNLDYAS